MQVREVITTKRIIVRKIPRASAAAGPAAARPAHALPDTDNDGAEQPPAPRPAPLAPAAAVGPHQTIGGVRVVPAGRSSVDGSTAPAAAHSNRFGGDWSFASAVRDYILCCFCVCVRARGSRR